MHRTQRISLWRNSTSASVSWKNSRIARQPFARGNRVAKEGRICRGRCSGRGHQRLAAGQYAGREIMPRISMYCTAVCPYCVAAERLLNSKGVRDIEKIRVDLQPARRMEMVERTGRRTVPQIYIDDRHV